MTSTVHAAMSPGFVYLASQSPRRRELLGQIGVRHELLVAGDDEDAEALEATRAGELPARYVERVTRAKLAAASVRRAARGLEPAPILCADTAVALGTRILGKPRDAADAAATLMLLSGRTHRVLSAVAVAARGRVRLRLSVSRVRFAAIDAARVARYVDGGEPFGKAGAYAIQGGAGSWVEPMRSACRCGDWVRRTTWPRRWPSCARSRPDSSQANAWT